MICPHKREAYIFSRVIHAAQDVEEVEINCNKVADTVVLIILYIIKNRTNKTNK